MYVKTCNSSIIFIELIFQTLGDNFLTIYSNTLSYIAAAPPPPPPWRKLKILLYNCNVWKKVSATELYFLFQCE